VAARNSGNGIAKINIGRAIRGPCERLMQPSVAEIQRVVYNAAVKMIYGDLEIAGSGATLKGI